MKIRAEKKKIVYTMILTESEFSTLQQLLGKLSAPIVCEEFKMTSEQDVMLENMYENMYNIMEQNNE